MLNFYMPRVSFLHKTVVILPIKMTGELLEACMLCPLPLWDAELPPLTCCKRSCKQSWGPAGLAWMAAQTPGGHHSTRCPCECVTSQKYICRSFPLLWLVCCTPFQASTENFNLNIKKISNFIFYYWLCNWNLNMPLFFSHIDSYKPHPLKWISDN